MSSHHIVREKQEPALFIFSMDHFPLELLGQLLEWSPTVIVTTESYYPVNELGIKIDGLVTTEIMDSNLQSPIKLIPSGEDLPIEAVLKYLINHDYPAVNIITDEFILKDYLLFADKINLVIYQAERKIYPVNSNFSKWKTAGECIELLVQPVNLQISGLEETGKHQYKTTHDGFFSLQFQQPLLFIAEYI